MTQPYTHAQIVNFDSLTQKRMREINILAHKRLREKSDKQRMRRSHNQQDFAKKRMRETKHINSTTGKKMSHSTSDSRRVNI